MTPGQAASKEDGGAKPPPSPASTNAEVQSVSDDAALQERYRQEYLIQLRRLCCPGCGEEPFA
jgi:hypothetical protein